MVNQGPTRLVAQDCLKCIMFYSIVSLIVGVLTLSAIPAKADTGISMTDGLFHKAVKPKRKLVPSSKFGIRRDPINKRQTFHKGIDISRPVGTEILAWSDGVVVKAGWVKGYGQTVDILHANGVKSRYAHLRTIFVRKGQKIRGGLVLGQVGRTGRTTGANLHFEIRVKGKLSDPTKIISDSSEIVAG